MTNNTLVVTDNMATSDKIVTSPETKNFIDVFNSKNEHVYRGYNIVVDKGRLFTLQNTFNFMTDSNLNKRTKPNLWASAFSVGDGAAPANNPFSPIAPNLVDTQLFNRVPFFAENTNRTNTDGDVSKPKYWSNTNIKDFTSVAYVNNASTGEMYYEITLVIDYSECKGKNINELGLYLANHTLSGATVTNKTEFTLFSKITFPSLPNSINDDTDQYTIIYRVYA